MNERGVDTRVLPLVLAVEVRVAHVHGETPAGDVELELRATATIAEVIEALCLHFKTDFQSQYGLYYETTTNAEARRHEVGAGFLPNEAAVVDCGLFDGARVSIRDRSLEPAPLLIVDTASARGDLFLVEDRGTHRGRVFRLGLGIPIAIGSAPTGEPSLVVDDRHVPAFAVEAMNEDGESVRCVVRDGEGVHVSGMPVNPSETASLLPGGTLSFRRQGAEIASFILTTASGAADRPKIGKVQFDLAARPADPVYRDLSDRVARVPATPQPPESQPFPSEQIIVPVAMAVMLYAFTKNYLTLLIAPLTAALPIVSYFRQRRQARQRYEKDRQKWLEGIDDSIDALSSVVGLEEQNLRIENPPPEEWSRRAYRRLAGLWSRSADRPDFLQVTLGRGRLESRYALRLDDGVESSDRDFQRAVEGEGRAVTRERVHAQLFDVPVALSFKDHHIGLAGPTDLVGDVATSLLVQIVCAHPPGAVSIAALLPAAEATRQRYEWLKWLPHTRAGSALLPAERIFAGRRDCNDFLIAMRALHLERRSHGLDDADDVYAVIIIHEAAEVDAALIAEVCDLTNGLVRILWLGNSFDGVPQLITAVVELSIKKDGEGNEAAAGKIRSGPARYHGLSIIPSQFSVPPLETARALAPLYDPRAAGVNAGIPASVPLSASVNIDDLSYADEHRVFLAKSLPVSFGVREAGVFELDLVTSGPHTLIGGTTGAGKSELLQALTSSLISRYSPAEVGLFLVDFKGGSTFAAFKDLPHVVGFVSDLDKLNARRALTFLRAELRRREEAFVEADDSKEYGDYLTWCFKRRVASVIPRLVVIFDEFATLVEDNKDAIRDVIDIARRGRSWGVHLVLATQQPTRDVVDKSVRGNVKTSIALQTLSADDSIAIIDRPDATRIPKALPGRAIARVGSEELVEFQTSYAGAAYVSDQASRPVTAADFAIRSPEEIAVAIRAIETVRSPDDKSQFEHLITMVKALKQRRSAGSRYLPVPLEQKPEKDPAWLTTAEPPVSDDVIRRAQDQIVLGLRDLPHKQRQDLATLRLQDGSVCVVGPSGSGRTTTLASITQQFWQATALPHIVAIDAAGAFTNWCETNVPCFSTASAASLEAATRVIDQLWLVMRSRMAADGDARTMAAYKGDAAILLVIDGYDALMRSFGSSLLAPWFARLSDLLANGRRYNIMSAISSHSVRDLDPPTIAGVTSLIELHAHYDETVPAEERLPGFGLDRDGSYVQLFLPTRTTMDSARADVALKQFLDGAVWRSAEPAAAPDTLSSLVLGRDEVTRLPVTIDLMQDHLLVAGGQRSGRSTVLYWLASQLASGSRAWLVAPRLSNPMKAPDHMLSIGVEDLKAYAKLDDESRRFFATDQGLCALPDGRVVVFVDDAHLLTITNPDGNSIDMALAEMHQQALIQVVAVTAASNVGRSSLTSDMKYTGVAMYVRPGATMSDTDDGLRLKSIPFHHRPGMVYVRGDTIVQSDIGQALIHIAPPS